VTFSASITIDAPTTTDATLWQPTGHITAGGAPGDFVWLTYVLTKPNHTTTTGLLGNPASITGTAWAYLSQAQFKTDLLAIGYATFDMVEVKAGLYSSGTVLKATSSSIFGGWVPQPEYAPDTTIVPDAAAALAIRIKRAPQIQDICGDRVSLILQDKWQMPQYAVIVTGVGGPAPDQETQRHFARIDVRCFGPGTSYNVRQRNAFQLWRQLHPVIVPPVSMRIAMCFHAAHCIVQHVRQDAEPIRMTEPGTDWPVVIVPYIVTYAEESI